MKWIAQNKSFLALVIFSIIWCSGALWLLSPEIYFDPLYFHINLNELGDYLAGVFSPLAFLWLIYGYFMQNSELKHQLREFEKSVEISNLSLSFNKRNQQKKDIVDHNTAQPVFDFEAYSDYSGNHYFKIINHASSATEICFFITEVESDVYYSEPIEKIIYLGKGEEKDFILSSLSEDIKKIGFAGMEKNEIRDVKIFLISYYDSYQIHQTIKAKLTIEHDKKRNAPLPKIEAESTRKSLPELYLLIDSHNVD